MHIAISLTKVLFSLYLFGILPLSINMKLFLTLLLGPSGSLCPTMSRQDSRQCGPNYYTIRAHKISGWTEQMCGSMLHISLRTCTKNVWENEEGFIASTGCWAQIVFALMRQDIRIFLRSLNEKLFCDNMPNVENRNNHYLQIRKPGIVYYCLW